MQLRKYLKKNCQLLQQHWDIRMKFIELTGVEIDGYGGPDKDINYYINVDNIGYVEKFPGYHLVIISMKNNEQPLTVKESYEQVIEMIGD